MAVKNLGRIVGLSAYEVWLEQGNTGTEQDYLNSLKGETGENGKDGKTPVKGEDYFTEEDKQEIIDELAGQGGEIPIYYETSGTTSEPFIFEGKKAGIYIFSFADVTYKRTEDSAVKTINTLDRKIYIFAEDDGVSGKPLLYYMKNDGTNYVCGFSDSGSISILNWFDSYIVLSNKTKTINAKHTYTKLPESSVAPTTDDQFTNKAYVDNAITTAINNITNGDEVSY